MHCHPAYTDVLGWLKVKQTNRVDLGASPQTSTFYEGMTELAGQQGPLMDGIFEYVVRQ
jgi:hypothetical protein